MTKKQFIQAFFKATHIDNNYSSYEKFLESGNCNSPSELDYIQEIVLPTECIAQIIENFEKNTDIYEFEDRYLSKYKDYDDFIKQGYDTEENDGNEYNIFDRYYDELYNIYYTEDGYYNIFLAFLKKYDLEKAYYDEMDKEFSIIEFILKYIVKINITNDYPMHKIIRRKDICCINLKMDFKEIESYIFENKLEQNLIELVKNNSLEYLFKDTNLANLF